MQVHRYGTCALLISRTSVREIDSGHHFVRRTVASGTLIGR
jgi:hypothetical protein